MPQESSYTISVTPQDSDGVSLTVSVAVEPGRLVVRELSVHAGEGGGTLPAELIDLDFAGLARTAVSLSRGGVPADEEPVPAPPAPSQQPAGRRLRSTGPTRNGVPSDFAMNYWRLGSIAKVADHYEVPRQTARDWVKTLRSGGMLRDPWSKRR